MVFEKYLVRTLMFQLPSLPVGILEENYLIHNMVVRRFALKRWLMKKYKILWTDYQIKPVTLLLPEDGHPNLRQYAKLVSRHVFQYGVYVVCCVGWRRWCTEPMGADPDCPDGRVQEFLGHHGKEHRDGHSWGSDAALKECLRFTFQPKACHVSVCSCWIQTQFRKQPQDGRVQFTHIQLGVGFKQLLYLPDYEWMHTLYMVPIINHLLCFKSKKPL